MKILTTDNLKVKFLGIIPILEKKIGFFNPQEIVSFSALLTFKGKDVQKLLEETLRKGEKVEEKIKKILGRSSLKGHASLSTTPVVCFLYEGSKFLDSLLTGMYFGSFLVSSGRRTDTTKKDIVYPENILKNKKAREIYRISSERIIDFYRFLLESGVKKDVASKILQYGIYGTGIIQLPLESIVSLKREYQIEKEWLPEEAGLLINKIESQFKKMGLDLLYSTRLIAPRNTYPYPNIFKNPDQSNLTRELMKEKRNDKGFRIISADFTVTPGLKEKLKELEKEIKKVTKSKKEIKKNWSNLLLLRRQISRDYDSALRIKVLSSVPWRVWGEKKRHRTCPQIIESIYFSVQRATQRFNKFRNQIKKGKINKKLVKEIEEVFSIPLVIKNNPKLLKEYLSTALNSFQSYQKLVRLKIKPREAIFLIPRAVKIDILQEYDLYNLLTGYYPLRLCQTAEEEMRRNTLREVAQIKKLLTKKGYGWLNKFIVPKCQLVGFCPEEKTCGQIKNLVKNYNDKFHQEMKDDLENKFQKVLKKI